MSWIGWALGLLVLAYAARELLLLPLFSLLGLAETADSLKRTRGERLADVARRISGYVIGWAMLLAGVIAIILALTEPPRTPVLLRIGIGAGGLLVSLLGAWLSMNVTEPRRGRRR